MTVSNGVLTVERVLGVGKYLFSLVNSSEGAPPTPRLSCVGGRCFLGRSSTGTSAPYNATLFDYARDDINAIRIDWPNFLLITGQLGGTLTGRVSVRYPFGTGTLQRLSYGGTVGASGSTSGPVLQSDLTPLPFTIPRGAKYEIIAHLSGTAGLAYSYVTQEIGPYVAGGDKLSQSATDYTDGTSYSDDGSAASGNMLFPCNILGMTTRRTLAILGDSRNKGGGTTTDALGQNGHIGRSLAQTYGSITLAQSGETAASFLGNYALRVALMTGITDVICGYGINDNITGLSLASMQSSLAAIRDLSAFSTQLAAGRYYQETLPPSTTSSDSWATLVNQAARGAPYSASNNAALNAWIRSGGLGSKVNPLDIAAVMESGTTQKWNVTGAANGYTADGTHEVLGANDLLLAALSLVA